MNYEGRKLYDDIQALAAAEQALRKKGMTFGSPEAHAFSIVYGRAASSAQRADMTAIREAINIAFLRGRASRAPPIPDLTLDSLVAAADAVAKKYHGRTPRTD